MWPGKGAVEQACRALHGKRDAVLEFIVFGLNNQESVFQKFWSVWGVLTKSDRLIVSLDDVCAAAGLMPSEFMSSLVKVAMQHNADISELTAASFEPRIIRQMAKSALRIGGEYVEVAQRDRMAMMQQKRHIPIPRNAAVQVNVKATANAAAAAAATNEPSVPDFLDDMESLQASKDTIQRALIGDVVETD